MKTLRRKKSASSSSTAKTFTRKDYHSRDGFKTSIWGPAAWHFLHTISFNYPMHPTADDKKHYKETILGLMYVLPCGKCRENFCKNINKFPLKQRHLKNRDTFSRYIYKLHEIINTMLNKKSGLTYEAVRDRYEDFRARCSAAPTTNPANKDQGCTEPLYGEKAKCVLKIIPEKTKCDTFQIAECCKKKRVSQCSSK